MVLVLEPGTCACVLCISHGESESGQFCHSEGEELWVSRAELCHSPSVSQPSQRGCVTVLFRVTEVGGAVGLGASGKGPTCRCRKRKRCRFNPWVGKIPSGRKWHPTPVFLPRKFHRQRKRSLSGYSSWGHRESDMTACRALQDSGHTSQVGHMICLFQLTVPFIFSPVKKLFLSGKFTYHSHAVFHRVCRGPWIPRELFLDLRVRTLL